MVVTEVWLEVKNGRTIVLDPQVARKQHKRWHKKRKPTHNSRANPSKKRKLACVTPNGQERDADAGQRDGEEHVQHENLQLFADAQAQLQLEMEAAGFGGDALPLSFGSAHPPTNSRKRQRQHQQRQNTTQEHPVEPQPAKVPAAMEKIHVTFDSDGEVADRIVEAVTAPEATVAPDATQAPAEQSPAEEATDAPESADVAELAEAVEEPPSDEPDVDPAVFKFWKQRRTLFHKYDEGIQLDRESWYSVTPEAIARHIAKRCACDVIVDPFSGCGGNIIQFAKTCKQVIAIELDAEKIRMAKSNAAIYGVADRIEWIHGDALQVLPTLQADVVFLSPPWGGMNYNRDRFGVEDMMIGETSGIELFEMARRISKNVVYYLPKTTPEADLQALTPEETVECEHIHLNGQLKVVNAYYGDLAFPQHDEQEDGNAGVEERADSAVDGDGAAQREEETPAAPPLTQVHSE